MNASEQKKKRIILFISENQRVSDEIRTLLADKYCFYFTDRLDAGESLLELHYDKISAILLDSMLAAEKGTDFISWVADEPRFMFIPIILTASGIPMNEEINCLSLGAVDIIVSPFHKKLTELRIENAIRLKDSASFHEIARMLRALPSNIYLKDADCRYIFATHYWNHLNNGDDPDWTIRGKTDIDIRKNKGNAASAMESDREIMKTGKGVSYIIEEQSGDKQEFFEVIKEPVWDKNNRICGIVGLINNVTEHEKLRSKLKLVADTDGLTGLLNRRKIQSKIEKNFRKMKNDGDPVSVIMLDIDNFKNVNDTYGHKEGDRVICTLADVLRDRKIISAKEYFAGRWGGEEFMVLLLNTELTEAERIAEKIRLTFGNTDLNPLPPQTVSLGVTQGKPSDTEISMYTRVDEALYDAKKSGKNIVRTIY